MHSYNELPDSTRVWVYQSNRPFDAAVLPALRTQIQTFVENWISHNNQLRAFGDVYHNRFIVLMVDESQAGASGCSIDKSVHFLQALGQHYQVDLFDRMQFSYLNEGTVYTVSKEEFNRLFAAGEIKDDTLVFDTLVSNKGDFDKNWTKPLADSWHKRMIQVH